ncbi:hypothetical protein [Nocardioides donggukensis]|uniref:Uncharacterized protein n=1 Tax=Nocardioides donggukensis TaxID=2774019 RepID=A0A927K335_9ACTN|nr:hypothetical protein [Nocardioides donggukensis]MBD8868836.1 hypothetical protein [Nocardioides donggukensis]
MIHTRAPQARARQAHPSRRRLGVLLALTALLLGSLAVSSQAHPRHRVKNLDLTAAAHPTEANPTVLDKASRTKWIGWRPLAVDTSATSSATCDGCRGDAVTLQLVYAHRPGDVALDNAAVAWSQCTDCRATALSVQVVMVRGGHEVTANNRALALNAACEGCLSNSLAVQLVVLDADGDELSHEAEDALRAWVDEQAAALRVDPPAAQRRAGPGPLDSLEALVNDDLGSETLVSDLDRG